VENIKILGVTFTNGLSVLPHVQHLTIQHLDLVCPKNSACRMGTQAFFHRSSVIVARLLYA